MDALNLSGKTALVLGIANRWSIAYAIAQQLQTHGVRLAVTYQNERVREEVHKLTRDWDNVLVLPCELTDTAQVEAVFDRPRFHEAVLRIDAEWPKVTRALEAQGIVGGYPLGDDYPELAGCVLVCATETKTEEDIDHYARHLARIVSRQQDKARRARKGFQRLAHRARRDDRLEPLLTSLLNEWIQCRDELLARHYQPDRPFFRSGRRDHGTITDDPGKQ